jgi:hypothetical protein
LKKIARSKSVEKQNYTPLCKNLAVFGGVSPFLTSPQGRVNELIYEQFRCQFFNERGLLA